VIHIKKYGNRRLYDTEDSRYITVEELAAKVQGGTDVKVQDAKSGEDLTQATLVQIIMESRGAARLLPVPLLVQLIRLNDQALGEFLGRYVASALELFLQARSGVQALAPYNPFASVPFGAADAFARLLGGGSGSVWSRPPPPAEPPPPPSDDVSNLRRELDELKRSLRKRPKKR
jgi:polyhydroxyalkanoate synthesis repressor PhaR